MTQRIPPDYNANRILSQEIKQQQAKQIQQVEEIDADQQRARNKFQQIMEDAEEEPAPTSELPSPFESNFYLAQSRSNAPNQFNLNETPSPEYSPPPDVNTLSPAQEDSLSDEDLPQSQDFWEQVDLPDQLPNQNLQLVEMEPRKAQAKKEPAASKESKVSKKLSHGKQEPALEEEKPFPGKRGSVLEKKESFHGKRTEPKREPSKKELPPEKNLEPSPFGPPGKAVKETTSKHKSTGTLKKEEEERHPPQAKYWAQEMPAGTSAQSAEMKGEKKVSGSRPSPSMKKGTEKSPPKPFAPVLKQVKEKEEKEEGKREQKKPVEIELTPPSLQALPEGIHEVASSAATSAAPYLRPQIIPIFYQMVGTIMMMSKQGVSTTEILLNNPAFAGSKFFGASIEIVKYATAPDSLNIRLSGSNEAVTAFNQNIPGLMAAFQTGNFRFRIGRIDAVYSAEKPVFRRKEKDEDTKGGTNEASQ